MTLQERAALRARREWPVTVYYPLMALTAIAGIKPHELQEWCTARGLTVPTVKLAKIALQRAREYDESVGGFATIAPGLSIAQKRDLQQHILKAQSRRMWATLRTAILGTDAVPQHKL